MKFATFLREQRKRKGLTLGELAEKIGSSKSYLSDIETGKRMAPRDRIVKALAKVLGVRQSELLKLAHFDRVPSDIMADLMRRDATGVAEMLAYPRSVDASDAAKPPVGSRFTTYVPLVNTVQTGYPKSITYLKLPTPEIVDYLRIPPVKDKRAFAITVCDDSMSSDTPVSFEKGNIIVLSPREKVRDGDLVVVALGLGRGRIKCLFRKVFFEARGGCFLKPLNRRYKVTKHSMHEVKAIWKVVARYGTL